jgi:hypothetical protein
MNTINEEICFEQKMHHISEIMEEIVLDAMLAALQKIKDRNLIFDRIAQNTALDNVRF